MRLLYRFRHVVLSLILLVGLYALLGFVVAPYLVKRYGVPAISEKLQRPVLLHDVQINPFALSIRLTGFEIQEPDQKSMIGFDELFIDFEAIISLFKQVYAFKEITVALPFVSARILPDKKLNLLGLLPPRPETPPPDKTEKAAIPLVQAGLIQIQSGVLEFRDESKKKPVMIDVVPIEILLRNFSTKPGKENPYAFTAEFGQGETFSWNGTFSLEPLESEGTISLANIDLLTFWRGVQDRFKFDLRSAALDLDIRYTFDQRADPINFRINDGKLAVRDLRLAEKGGEEPLVSIPSVKIDEMRLDLASRDIKIGTIATGQGRIRGWLEPDGSVNYVPLLASTDSEDHDKPGPAPDTAAAATTQAEPWSIVVKTVQVNDYGATFEDRSLSPAAQIHIEDMRATVRDVRMPFAKPMNVSVGLTLNKSGHVETEGSVGLNPMRADLRLHLSHIGLKSFQPYANRFVQADIDGGELHVDGAVRYAGKSADDPLLAYDGKVSLTDFELADRASKKPAVSWDSLALTKMAVRLSPTSVKVGEIEWRKPSIQVVKDSDGTLNLSRIAGGTGAPPAKAPKSGGEGTKPAGKGTAPPISVDTVKLVKMDTTFVDQSIEPPVITGIQGLSGTIKGLSSKELARAKVSLAGKVDKIAPMKIQGEINPLSETTYTDLKVLFDNVNLIAASPYAGKYAGFPITKGKLYLDLMYRVSKNQLHGENKVTIDQFTFGEKTDSPDATSLPVRLAVALLKDRHGKIEVDLPVRGDLNEPDFKYGRVLLDALANLITKVAASPFAAIGNLVGGGGEELQYVAFEPGSAELTDADRSKLQMLEKALNERPALRLDVEGRADPELDGRALAQQKVEAAILARYEKTNKKTAASPPSADRRLELLNELYIQQFGKQPMKREEIAGGKTVERVMSGEEVKNELAATQKVTEVELRQLAQNRAVRIREFLVGQNHANQGLHAEPANQVNAVAEAKQEDQGDQVKEGNQDSSSNRIEQEQAKQEGQDNHMSEDRVFLLDVELSGSGGEQVRCKLNLSGA